jgi:hypothetical protein
MCIWFNDEINREENREDIMSKERNETSVNER